MSPLGAADDYFRHCLTKMASLHFPACEEYAARVVRMGEAPETVHCVGGLGDENIRSLPLLGKDALAQSWAFRWRGLCPCHLSPRNGGRRPAPPRSSGRFCARWKALTGWTPSLPKRMRTRRRGHQRPYSDEACAQKPGSWAAFTSLGVLRYLSAMKYAAAVVGNSSSGVVETPTFRVPAVNIGARQKGRIICANVLCCEADEADIRAALETALSPAFRQKAAGAKAIRRRPHSSAHYGGAGAMGPKPRLWPAENLLRRPLQGGTGMSWDEIVSALSMLWARQKPELLQLLQPGLNKALRLALVGTVLMAVLLAALLAGASRKKAEKWGLRRWVPALGCA